MLASQTNGLFTIREKKGGNLGRFTCSSRPANRYCGVAAVMSHDVHYISNYSTQLFLISSDVHQLFKGAKKTTTLIRFREYIQITVRKLCHVNLQNASLFIQKSSLLVSLTFLALSGPASSKQKRMMRKSLQ